MSERGWIEFEDVEVIHETERALLCMINDEEQWVPKDCIGDDSEVTSMMPGEDKGTLVLAEWFVKKNGL